MELRDYQKDTIELIREQGDAFDDWTDEAIADFYSDWSERFFAAGWIAAGHRMFYTYAITKPIDRWGMLS